MNNTSETWGANRDEFYSKNNQKQGYRRSQCNANEKMITISENKNYYNEDTLNLEYRFQGKGDSCNMNDEQAYVIERKESCNVNNKKLKSVKIKSQGDQENTNETFNKTIESSSAAEKYLDEERVAEQSYCLERMAFSTFVRGVFVWKYHTNKDEAHAFLRSVDCLTGADIDTLLKGQRKSNCTRCQYYCFLTCLTLTGAMMPPTPSPFSSPNNFNTKWQKLKSPMYPTKITEQQYHDLYGDFKIANDVKNYQSQREGIAPNKIVDLSALVEDEMRKIIHTFNSEVFTTLVEEYLKLFEEMVKGLILLKETGITLEDICSIGDENHAHYCQKATRISDKDSIVSFSEPYNAIEFEELLLEQVKQFRNKEDAKSAYVQAREPNQNPISSNSTGRMICDCRIGEKENPYFDFLSHIHSNDLPSSNTEEFDQILRTEKQMFLKSCLELLRDNDYFRIHGQSSLESVDDAKFNTTKGGSGTQDIVEEEMYKMSVSIYNKTVCHVQSSIFAIFRSMKQSPGRHRLLPPTPKTTHSDRNIGGSECTDQIKNALSDYLRGTDQSASSEDEVFIRKDNLQDKLMLEQSDKYEHNQPESQTISSVRYENEITHRGDHYNDRQIQYEPNKRRCLRNEKEAPPRQEEIMQQHPDLDYTDTSRQIYKERERNHPTENFQGHTTGTNLPYFTQIPAQTNRSLQNRQEPTAAGFQEQVQTIGTNTVIIPPSPREIEACFFNKSLFRKKKKDASVVCVLNYHNPEVSHMDAIDFLKKMETEGGVLHYPYCSENNLLTKMESPSFYLSVCCSDCQQELAPAEKLEAFKSETKNLHRSKLVSHIIGKNRAPFYFPVRCGSCNHFLCEPQKGKKLLVPFHSATNGNICASRLKSHTCEPNSSEKDYTGCPSDTINNSTQVLKKTNEYVSESHETNITSNRKRMTRSRSLPVLGLKDLENRDVIKKNEKGATRMNTPLKFEEAVSNILHIWTYEMIDYEKGANTPHLRSQILNYRKSLSIFIKKDIREKLYYRHILSVFKRVEDYESPILDFKTNLSTQKGALDYKIMKKSRSCHSKLSYEASSATRRSKVESLEYNNNTAALIRQSQSPSGVVKSSFLRPGTMNRNNLTRPLSLHSELKQKSPAAQRRRSYSFTESAYKEDFSTQMNAWKNELQELQKSIESPDLRFETINRKNIARPVSLHSELKQKSVTVPHRRRSSCSYAGESRYEDYSTQITVWKNELLKLQKSVESPYLGTDAANRHNTTRPLSLHCDINQKPSAQRRRSCSFTDTVHKDLSTNIDAWKIELQNLQKSVESPNMRFGAINRIHYTKPNTLRAEPERTATSATHRPKSESFINQFSAQINKSKVELLRLQKSFETLRMRTKSIQHKRHTDNIVNSSVIKNAALTPSRRQSESVINKQYSSELNAWKNELLKLQKNVESPHLLSNARDRNIKIRTGSLDSESKRITSAAPPLNSVLEDSLTELKTWNHKLRELERDATSPGTGNMNRRIKIRAHSLHTEPKRTNLHGNRPKSESVLDDFSTELQSWKHELLTLEEDAKNPQTEQRKINAKSRSLHSQPIATAYKVNFETIDNNGDLSRKNVEMSQLKIKQSNTANIASSQKSPVRRYSSTPRQLPAIPDHRSRRHSHYETTEKFVNLLTDRRATRLNTHARNTTITSSNYDCAEPSLARQDDAPNAFLRPDEGAARARFFSQ